MIKNKQNSHEFPKSLLSFASEDFWNKEPWKEEGIVGGGRVREVRRRRGGVKMTGEGWWKSNLSQQKNKLNKWDSNKLMSRSDDDTGKRSFLIWPLHSRSVYWIWRWMKRAGRTWRFYEEWCDPSTGLSASAAAGLMLAGEGNGRADKVWAPTESIEPTALHLSLKGGWRGWCVG